MNENLSLGRIAGIHVGLNWSLLVVAGLIAWSLATGILPPAAPGYSSAAYWTAGLVAAVVYLASLLAHELAHSVVATRRGVRADRSRGRRRSRRARVTRAPDRPGRRRAG